MKPMKQLITASILGITILSSSAIALAGDELWGAAAAAADQELTLADMLTYSLQDEYLAHDEYELILEKFGMVRPFSNIVKAEEKHISQLLPLFAGYEIALPSDDTTGRIHVGDTLAESYPIGVEAEILNIAMYERFLKEELPADVKAAFERLLAGSENHLAAFQRAVAREDGTVTAKNNSGDQRGRSDRQSPTGKSNQMMKRSAGTPNQAMGQRPGAPQSKMKAPGSSQSKAGAQGLRDGSCR